MKVADIAAATDKWLGDCADLSAAECQANCAWLTDRCDGARSQDGSGWGRYDRATGTLLARRPADRWSTDDLRRGRRLSAQVPQAVGDAHRRDDAAVDRGGQR